MSSALIVLGGIVFIALSLWLKFTPRLRVIAGIIVGALLTHGTVTDFINRWTAKGITTTTDPIADLLGQDHDAVAQAIPSAVAFGLALFLVLFLRGKSSGGGKSSGKGAGGGGGRGTLAHVALACGLLLPILAGGIGEVIRSVTA
jgi:hypothetical protein